MAMWIVVGMLAAAAFGFSMLPVLVVGAIAMSGLSFVLTRDKRIPRVGLGFGVMLFNHLMVQDLLTKPDLLEIPSWVSWLASDSLLAITSCVVILFSMYIGIFGPVQHLPLDMEGVLKVVKGHDKNHRDPDDKP